MTTKFIEQRLDGIEKRLAKMEREHDAAAPSKPESGAENQHGIKRPSQGTKCRAVWDAMDKLLAQGETPTSKLMRQLALVVDWNPNNATAELSSWRKFHGLPNERAV